MKKLTPGERQKKHDLQLRLQSAGVPISTHTDETPDLLIRQHSEHYESVVFDANGGTGLILPLAITVNMTRFAFCGFDIRLDCWPEAGFRLLERNIRDQWPHYEFSGITGRKFDKGESINEFLEKQKEIPRGRRVHGLLFGFCYKPMIDEIRNGAAVHGSLKLIDQFENGRSIRIALRGEREVRPMLRPNLRRGSLFSRPDFRADSEDAS